MQAKAGPRGVDGVDLNIGCWSVRGSGVVEQMTHGGTVAEPCDNDGVRR
jgi:hypothetical protein